MVHLTCSPKYKSCYVSSREPSVLCYIAIKITDFQREIAIKPSSATAQANPNIALAM